MIARAVQAGARAFRRLRRDSRGASTLEFALITAVIAIPMVWIFDDLLGLMVDYYRMMTFLNGWPFP